jgi:hypothetical protein
MKMKKTILLLTIAFGLCAINKATAQTVDSGTTGDCIWTITGIEATPNAGYRFVRWMDANTANPRTVTVTQDATYTATFEAIPVVYYHITVDVNDPDMGAVTGEGDYEENSYATIEATPNAGYRFVRWMDGNLDNPRTVTVTQDATYIAIFEAIPVVYYHITVDVNNPNMGTVAGEGDYPYNTETEISANPADGCFFVRWSDGNTNNPRTVTVTSDMTFTAEFVRRSGYCHITLYRSPEDGGTVSGAGDYEPNTEAVISATPASGYRFVQWNDGNTDNPRTVTVTEDMTFTAEFEVIAIPVVYYHVTVDVNNPDMGAVTGEGDYEENSIATIEATANAGYRFVKWGDNITDNPRTVTVTEDMTFTAEFEAIAIPVVYYHITVNANDPDMGAVTGEGDYEQNSIVTIEATANEGYRFVKWGDNIIDNPRTVVVTGDMTFTARFVKENTGATYQITVRSSDTNRGTVDGGGKYAEGEEVMLIASPKSGYHFDRWQDKNTDNPRLIIVTANATYIAVFAVGSDDTSESPTPSDDTVVVYPNPARNLLYIQSPVTVEQVVIRDLNGQQVKHIASPAGREVDISDLASGVYLVGITTVAGEIVRKIVIND